MTTNYDSWLEQQRRKVLEYIESAGYEPLAEEELTAKWEAAGKPPGAVVPTALFMELSRMGYSRWEAGLIYTAATGGEMFRPVPEQAREIQAWTTEYLSQFPLTAPVEEDQWITDTLQKVDEFIIDWSQTGVPQAITEETILTPEDAKKYGIELDEGYTLKITPIEGGNVTTTLIDPEGGQYTDQGSYISPEGQEFTAEDIAEQRESQEALIRVIYQVIPGAQYSEEKLDEALRVVGNNPQWFVEQIQKLGHTEDTEATLRLMFEGSGLDEAGISNEIARIFEERYQWTWPSFFRGLGMEKVPGWIQTFVGGQTGKGGILAAFNALAAPWNTLWYTAHMAIHSESQYLESGRELREAIEASKLNPFWMLSGSYQDKAENYAREAMAPWQTITLDLINPVWYVPIGGTAGFAASLVRGVPIIGRGARAIAAATIATEKAVSWPIAKPLELLGKGGQRLTVTTINKIVSTTKGLENPLEMPSIETIIEGQLRDNWMRSALQNIATVPGLRKPIEMALGTKILIRRASVAIEDIVGKGWVGWGGIASRGQAAAAVKQFELQAMIKNQVKFFGFNERAFSQKMFDRLLPEFKGTKNAGTLEHVFTHPDVYNWAGMDRGLEYVTRVREINAEILELLTKHGVQPEHMMEDWMHRVVEGVYDRSGKFIEVGARPGRRLFGRRRIGARPSYEMPRRFDTMQEGIDWGVKYNRDPMVSVSTYIQEAYRKIADKEFTEYLAKELEAIGKAGVTPSEALFKRFPELFEEITGPEGRRFAEKAVLRADELASANKFSDVIIRAIRGEIPPEQTLKAIEKRFPELGQRFRGLVKARGVEQQTLRNILGETENQLRQVRAELAKGKTREAAEALKPIEIPSEQGLRTAFEALPYEDRVEFRNYITAKRAEVEEMIAEQSDYLAGIKESFQEDAIYNMPVKFGKKQRPLGQVLFALLTPEGEWPETLTKSQARMVMMGREIKPAVVNKQGRVQWEYVLDELAEHFNMTEDELIKHLEAIRAYQVTASDVSRLVADAELRGQDLDRMLKVIGDVDAIPTAIPEAAIPKAEPGMPEAGLQADIFGYATPVYPTGKGIVTQMSMEDYAKLVELHQKAGLPPPDVGIKPKIEGVKGLEAETEIGKVVYEPSPVKTTSQVKVELGQLRKEVKAITEARKIPYWETRAERKIAMEKARLPSVKEGYVMQPFASGKVFDREFVDAFNKFFGRQAGLPGLTVLADVVGIGRILQAALDMSWWVIQGLVSWGVAHSYLLTNPEIGMRLCGSWYKTYLHGVGIFFDPQILAKWITKNEPTIMQRTVGYGGSIRVIDIFQVREGRTAVGRGMSWAMGKLPLKPYDRAEAVFLGAGEMVRDEFWRILSPKAIAKGEGFECARFLDLITGLTDAVSQGVPLSVRQIEQAFMWFAPNYTRACLTVLSDIFRGGYTGRQARRAIAGLVGAGSAFYSATRFSLSTLQGKSPEEAWKDVQEGFCVYQDSVTGEWSWKINANFMTIPIGNYNFGIGGFWYGLMRLTGNIIQTVAAVGDREPIDLVRIIKNGSFNKRDNPFIYWWYSRSSPLTGAIYELTTNRNFLGYPIETPQQYGAYILSRVSPIWAESGLLWMIPGVVQDYAIPEGAARAAVPALEFLGFRSFPESAWVKFYDLVTETVTKLPDELFNEYFPDKSQLAKILEARDQGKLEWGQLPPQLQNRLLLMFPQLDEAHKRANQDSFLRDTAIGKQWEAQRDEERTIYYERGENLWQRLLGGELDTRTLREFWSEAGDNYGIALDMIEKNPDYQVLYENWAKRAEEGDSYEQTIELALREYQTIMFADFTDINGDMDWDARDAAIQDFIDEHGQETYDLIRQYWADERLLQGMNSGLVQLGLDKDKLRDYWNIAYDPDTGEGSEEREAYRKSHPEDDAILFFWGYGGMLQSKTAYDLVVEKARDLGVPLDSIGGYKKLPPSNLVNVWFQYYELPSGTARNQLRWDNPAFDAWLVETQGYKPIREWWAPRPSEETTGGLSPEQRLAKILSGL